MYEGMNMLGMEELPPPASPKQYLFCGEENGYSIAMYSYLKRRESEMCGRFYTSSDGDLLRVHCWPSHTQRPQPGSAI